MSNVTQPTLSVIGKGDRLMAHHVGAGVGRIPRDR